MEMLRNGFRLFAQHCVRGISANAAVCKAYAENSTSLATVAGMLYGYEAGSRVAARACAENIACREAAVREGLIRPDEAEELFNVETLADRRATVNMLARRGIPRPLKRREEA
jgi:aspartate ammonia-lyase